MGYQSRGRIIAGIPLLYALVSGACTTQAPTTEQTQRPAVSQPLEQRAAGVLRKFNEQELITAYERFVAKVSPDIQERLNSFAQNSKYSDISNVFGEDYAIAVEQAKKAKASDPDVALILNLTLDQITAPTRGFRSAQDAVVVYANQNLDISRAKRENATFYIARQGQLQAFEDPNMLIPDSDTLNTPFPESYSSSPFSIESPLVYNTPSGMKTVLIRADHGNGAHIWVPISYFSTTPTDYTKTLIRAEVQSKQFGLEALNDFMKHVRPNTSPADLEKMLSDQTNDRLAMIANNFGLLGEGEPSLTYARLQEIAVELKRRIDNLNQILK